MRNSITPLGEVKQNDLTMTSREISALCAKDHKNVIRDIRVMLDELDDGSDLSHLDRLKFERTYKDASNRDQKEYCLPKDLTLTLVSGYSIQMRKRIIDRWLELEEKVSKPVSSTPELSRMQLIQLALQAEEEKLALEHKVEELAPKAKALDRFATFTDGSFCLRDAAKTLQMQEKRFIQCLHEMSWIYRRPMGTGWLAYSDKLQSGLMEHKVTTGQKGDGSEWASTQPRVTAKGLAKLSEMFSLKENAA